MPVLKYREYVGAPWQVVGVTSEGIYPQITVTGLAETDTVYATMGTTVVPGKWETEEVSIDLQIPAMTSSTSPSGVASASSSYTNFPEYYAFDGTDATMWNPAASSIASETYLQYEFERSVSFRSITVVTANGAKTDYAEYTYSWVIQGSTDGVNWVNISNEQSHKSGYATTLTVNSLTNDAFKYLRMQFLSSTDGYTFNEGKHGLSIISMQVDAYYRDVVNCFSISPLKELGTWTLTATNGVDTEVQQVLVDTVKYYETEMEGFNTEEVAE